MTRYIKQTVNSVPSINAELTKIQEAINDTLSRKGDVPNQMEGSLDMNSERILNLPDPVSDREPLPYGPAKIILEDAQAAAAKAEQEADRAEDAANIAVQYPEGQLASALAAPGSDVLIGGVEAQTMAELVQQVTARTKNGIVYGDDGRRYRVISAVIRNSGSGWFIINDSVHEPTGLQSVNVQPDGTIQLVHNVGATEVGTLVATPDETFATWGLIAGGSIGNFSSFLTLAAPLEFLVNTSTGTVTAPGYLGNTVTAEVVGGSCTITHPTVLNNTVAVAEQIGSANKVDINVSYGQSSVVIDGVGDVDGYIRWDGVSWQYTGNLRTTPTFVFSGGELTVTHPNADQFNLALIGRENGLRVGAGAVDKTSFKVRFYDAAGNQVTAISTLMKFYVARRAKALKTTIEGNVAVKRGYVKLNADDVISATGNIWIYGLMVI